METASARAISSELLRFATGGSVDDGKSTLIGRLLYDSKQIFQDQLEAVQRTRVAGARIRELAAAHDGLRANANRAITIDVAYRTFSTRGAGSSSRTTPSHTAHPEPVIIGLLNGRPRPVAHRTPGPGRPSRRDRHAMIASVLGIRPRALREQEMDRRRLLETCDQEIRDEFIGFSERLQVYDLTCIPHTRLRATTIVERFDEMPWSAALAFSSI